MSLDTIYLDTILKHYREPQNMGVLDPYDGRARGHNPNCGDDLTVYVRVHEGEVSEVQFEGRGCAISLSSASMMTGAVTGKPVGEVRAVIAAFLDLMAPEAVVPAPAAGEPGGPDAGSDRIDLGELAVLEGVKRYEARIRCATLAWQALEEALEEALEDAEG